MQSQIIIGSEPSQQAYLQAFIQKFNIKLFHVNSFEGTVKISDVHEIVRSSHIHLGISEKRLIILNGIITIPAQNALLKFLEELPDETFVLFLVKSKDELLETIVSRSGVVMLENQRDDSISTVAAAQVLNNTSHSRVMISAQNINNIQEYEYYLLNLRKVIIQQILLGNVSQVKDSIGMLRYLHKQFQIVKENNISPKFTLETV